jgi:hypothetical protein
MTQIAETTSTTTPNAKSTHDVVRRGIPRDLYCKLTDEEQLRIAKTRATREAERDQLLVDLADETSSRKAQIKKLDDEIGKMGRELRTGEQERTIPTNEIFVKHDDGTGWIYVIRQDTDAEVERRPATAHETQRYLPSLDGGGGLLGQAAKAQRSAQGKAASEESDIPSDGEDGEDGEDGAKEADGADEDESKPKRNGKKGK